MAVIFHVILVITSIIAAAFNTAATNTVDLVAVMVLAAAEVHGKGEEQRLCRPFPGYL